MFIILDDIEKFGTLIFNGHCWFLEAKVIMIRQKLLLPGERL